MLKFVVFVSIEPIKSVFLTMVKRRRFGTVPKTALSIDRDFDPADNVNVLISTIVVF